MPGQVDKALSNAIKALQDARRLAAKSPARNPTAGKEARARLALALQELRPLQKLKALGPDTGEGPLSGTDSGL